MIRFGTGRKTEATEYPPIHEVLGIAPSSGSPWGSTRWKLLRRCPREFFLTQSGVVKSNHREPALDYGIAYHHVLEVYYRALQGGADHPGAVQEAWGALAPMREIPECAEMYSTLERMLVSYFELAANDRWRVIAVEEEIVYEGRDFNYSVRLDLLVEDLERGGMWVVEHKSAQTITADLTAGYSLDLQVLGQIWIVQECVDLTQYPPFKGVIVNITSKQKVPQHQRVEVTATRAHLAEWRKSVCALADMETLAKRHGWPKALGNCTGAPRYFKQCAFFDICHGKPNMPVDNLDEYALPMGFVVDQNRKVR